MTVQFGTLDTPHELPCYLNLHGVPVGLVCQHMLNWLWRLFRRDKISFRWIAVPPAPLPPAHAYYARILILKTCFATEEDAYRHIALSLINQRMMCGKPLVESILVIRFFSAAPVEMNLPEQFTAEQFHFCRDYSVSIGPLNGDTPLPSNQVLFDQSISAHEKSLFAVAGCPL